MTTSRRAHNNLTLACLRAAAALTVAVAADRTVLYPKHKSGGGGGLVCYRDRREDGGAFWSYADDRQRRPHAFHCPSSASAWCVVVATGQLSVRGCSGPAGVDRAGCFSVVPDPGPGPHVTSKVCLCNSDYCNAAAATSSSALVAAVAAAVVVSTPGSVHRV